MKAAKRIHRKFYKSWDILKKQNLNSPQVFFANWTVKDALDLSSYYKLELEKELAKIVAKEIDAEVLKSITEYEINKEA